VTRGPGHQLRSPEPLRVTGAARAWIAHHVQANRSWPLVSV
jgi:hypothetical protein